MDHLDINVRELIRLGIITLELMSSNLVAVVIALLSTLGLSLLQHLTVQP